MKLKTSILAITFTIAASAVCMAQAAAQNVDAIDNARSTVKAIEQKDVQTDRGHDAASGSAAKPAPGAPAPAVKPAVIPGEGASAQAPAAKPAATPKAVTASSPASAAHNQLKKVNVVAGSDSFRIELVSSEAVAGKASRLKSPDRVLVELPGTTAATRENRIAVGDGGIKGIRIGTDGKNPPTTSVVVDLEKSCAYELTPGPSGTLVLTLHTDALANNNPPAAGKVPGAASKTVQATAAKANPAPAAKVTQTAQSSTVAASKPAPPAKTTKVTAKPAAPAKTVAVNAPAAKRAGKQTGSIQAEAQAPQPDLDADLFKPKAEEKKPEDKKWAMTGKRDPFFSPVVQQSGSGCSTGKKCLEIGNINLRGVVKSDSGFIAVVTNNLNKAYFLRENDPVFNGYVVKITGDSVVFQETVEDKLGKPFTREIVKRIFTPAV